MEKVENFEFNSQKCPKHGSDWYLAEKGHRTLLDPEKAYIQTQGVLTEDRLCNLYKKWAVLELFSLVFNKKLPKSAVFQMSPCKKTLNESWSRILFNVALFLLISWLFLVAYSIQRVLFHVFTVNFLFEDLRN